MKLLIYILDYLAWQYIQEKGREIYVYLSMQPQAIALSLVISTKTFIGKKKKKTYDNVFSSLWKKYLCILRTHDDTYCMYDTTLYVLFHK